MGGRGYTGWPGKAGGDGKFGQGGGGGGGGGAAHRGNWWWRPFDYFFETGSPAAGGDGGDGGFGAGGGGGGGAGGKAGPNNNWPDSDNKCSWHGWNCTLGNQSASGGQGGKAGLFGTNGSSGSASSATETKDGGTWDKENRLGPKGGKGGDGAALGAAIASFNKRSNLDLVNVDFIANQAEGHDAKSVNHVFFTGALLRSKDSYFWDSVNQRNDLKIHKWQI